MIAVRLDPNLAARVDPSDVVQETMAAAVRRLPRYFKETPISFYPWLRQIAWDRLVDLHRQHVTAKKRSVKREEYQNMGISEDSVASLAGRFVDGGTSASAKAIQNERRSRMRAAMATLNPPYHEVIVMRHLEQLSISEIATVLKIGETAVKTRLVRALNMLRDHFSDQSNE